MTVEIRESRSGVSVVSDGKIVKIFTINNHQSGYMCHAKAEIWVEGYAAAIKSVLDLLRNKPLPVKAPSPLKPRVEYVCDRCGSSYMRSTSFKTCPKCKGEVVAISESLTISEIKSIPFPVGRETL